MPTGHEKLHLFIKKYKLMQIGCQQKELNLHIKADPRKKKKYIYIEEKNKYNYKFIPTSLFRGRPLIRGVNENKLYHRLYTIKFV